MEISDASNAVSDESAAPVYSKLRKIILFSALIAEFFCCACIALPAPFLPKLVSTRFMLLLVYIRRNTQYEDCIKTVLSNYKLKQQSDLKLLIIQSSQPKQSYAHM